MNPVLITMLYYNKIQIKELTNILISKETCPLLVFDKLLPLLNKAQ